MRDSAHEKLYKLLTDTNPEVSLGKKIDETLAATTQFTQNAEADLLAMCEHSNWKQVFFIFAHLRAPPHPV